MLTADGNIFTSNDSQQIQTRPDGLTQDLLQLSRGDRDGHESASTPYSKAMLTLRHTQEHHGKLQQDHVLAFVSICLRQSG